MIKLVRSAKTINKPVEPSGSQGLAGLRKQLLSVKEKALNLVAKVEGKPKEGHENQSLLATVKAAVKWLIGLMLNKSFCIDELINIFRPVVYIYAVLKFGRRSYKPIRISILLDIF